MPPTEASLPIRRTPADSTGGAFDGRYVYFAPWREDPDENDDREYTPHGKVLRYDTVDDASFILKYAECGHNGGLCASLPGPTFTIDTEDGTRSVRANRTLAPGRHHLAGVYDGERVTLYIDGAAVASTEASGHVQSGNTPVSVGRLAGGGAPFQGEIGGSPCLDHRSNGAVDRCHQSKPCESTGICLPGDGRRNGVRPDCASPRSGVLSRKYLTILPPVCVRSVLRCRKAARTGRPFIPSR